MTKQLQGKTALVTGAARGIGADIAKAFARAGAAVMITDILADTGQQTAAEIVGAGGRASFHQQDVRDEAAWESAVAATVAEFGGLDILVNNAGIEETGLIAEFDVQAFRCPECGGKLRVIACTRDGFTRALLEPVAQTVPSFSPALRTHR